MDNQQLSFSDGERIEARTQLGRTLRESRRGQKRKDSIVSAAKRLGVNKNTLLSYENGRSLPDLSFLAVFSLEFEIELPVLLASRLKADDDERVRQAATRISNVNPKILTAPAGHLAWALRLGLLSDIIEVVENVDAKGRTRKLSPQTKARFIASLYNMLHNKGEIDKGALHYHAGILRSTLTG